MAEKTCQWCRNPYSPKKRIMTSVYCSRECYQAMRQSEASRFDLKSCEQCGSQFGPRNRSDGGQHYRQTDFRNRRFCSPKCFTDSLKLTIDGILGRLETSPRSECRIWTGHRIGFYGSVRWQGRNQMVHRVIWEHFRGPIPEGLQIDHTCGVKLCCNVNHLRIVTARENSLAATSNNMAARNHRRVKCPLCGGPYSARANGVRFCKPCHHRNQMAYQRRMRAAKRIRKSE